MLKKRHSTIKVSIAAAIVFVCAALILWKLENRISYYNMTAYIVSIVSIGIIGIIYTFNLTVGREVEIVDIPSDYPPKRIDPIQAGTILDGHVNQRDVAAAFYYLAQRGYFNIREYELKKFEFTYVAYPSGEVNYLQYLFREIFGDAGKSGRSSGDQAGEEAGVSSGGDEAGRPGEREDARVVTLTDAADRIAAAVPIIEKAAYRSISKQRNKEIAVLTGKVNGFRNSLLANRDEKAAALAAEDPDYVYKVLPYAYAFSITSKLCSNFEQVSIDPPSWYKPYGEPDDYVFDVVIYNAMLRNLPEQLRKEVFSKTADTYPAVGNL